MGGMQACCNGAQGSEEDRLKEEYLNQLKQNSAPGAFSIKDKTLRDLSSDNFSD